MKDHSHLAAVWERKCKGEKWFGSVCFDKDGGFHEVKDLFTIRRVPMAIFAGFMMLSCSWKIIWAFFCALHDFTWPASKPYTTSPEYIFSLSGEFIRLFGCSHFDEKQEDILAILEFGLLVYALRRTWFECQSWYSRMSPVEHKHNHTSHDTSSGGHKHTRHDTNSGGHNHTRHDTISDGDGNVENEERPVKRQRTQPSAQEQMTEGASCHHESFFWGHAFCILFEEIPRFKMLSAMQMLHHVSISSLTESLPKDYREGKSIKQIVGRVLLCLVVGLDAFAIKLQEVTGHVAKLQTDAQDGNVEGLFWKKIGVCWKILMFMHLVLGVINTNEMMVQHTRKCFFAGEDASFQLHEEHEMKTWYAKMIKEIWEHEKPFWWRISVLLTFSSTDLQKLALNEVKPKSD